MANARVLPNDLQVQTNLTGAVTDIDDDPDSPDGLWLTSGSNNNTTVRVGFANPPGAPLTTGSGLQEFRALLRLNTDNGNANETWTMYLYENGSQVGTALASGTGGLDTTGVVVSGTWDASSLADGDGTNVECHIVMTSQAGGPPGGRGSVEVGAIEWNAEYDTVKTAVPNASSSAAAAATAYKVGPADLQSAVRKLDCPASPGNATLQFPFVPKALLLWGNTETGADGSLSAGNCHFIGMSDGATEHAASIDRPATGTGGGRVISSTQCILLDNPDGTTALRATVSSIAADGTVTFNFTSTVSGMDVYVFAVGGDDITDVALGTYSMTAGSVTGLGFSPDLVINFSGLNTSSSPIQSFGAFDGQLNEFWTGTVCGLSGGTANKHSLTMDQFGFMGVLYQDAIDQYLTLNSIDAGGWSWTNNGSATANTVAYIALKTGNKARVGVMQRSATAGAHNDDTGLPFVAESVILSSGGKNYKNSGTSDGVRWTLGAADRDGNEFSILQLDEDDTSNADMWRSLTKGYATDDDYAGGTVEDDADVTFPTDGQFRLAFDAGAAANDYYIGYIAFQKNTFKSAEATASSTLTASATASAVASSIKTAIPTASSSFSASLSAIALRSATASATSTFSASVTAGAVRPAVASAASTASSTATAGAVRSAVASAASTFSASSTAVRLAVAIASAASTLSASATAVRLAAATASAASTFSATLTAGAVRPAVASATSIATATATAGALRPAVAAASSSFSAGGEQTNSVTNEVTGSGGGTSTYNSTTLNQPIVPGSFSAVESNNGDTWTDNGDGTLTSGVGNGTIDYTTGEFTLNSGRDIGTVAQSYNYTTYSLSAGAVRPAVPTASSSFTASATAQSVGLTVKTGTASASSTLSATLSAVKLAAATPTATSTFTASLAAGAVRPAVASASSSLAATLSAGAIREGIATATSTASATLTAARLAAALASATSAFAASLSAGAIREGIATATSTASATLTAGAVRSADASATSTLSASLTAGAIRPAIPTAASTFVAAATAQSVGSAVKTGTATASSVFAATSTAVRLAAAVASAASTFTGSLSAGAVRPADASATSSFAAASTASRLRNGSATAASSFTATLSVVTVRAATASASSSFSTTLSAGALRSAQASAAGSLAAFATASAVQAQLEAAGTAVCRLIAKCVAKRVGPTALRIVQTGKRAQSPTEVAGLQLVKADRRLEIV